VVDLEGPSPIPLRELYIEFRGHKFREPGDLVLPKSRIHECGIQRQTGSLSFRATVPDKIRKGNGRIDGMRAVMRDLHFPRNDFLCLRLDRSAIR
jgi:hypothetical protein